MKYPKGKIHVANGEESAMVQKLLFSDGTHWVVDASGEHFHFLNEPYLIWKSGRLFWEREDKVFERLHKDLPLYKFADLFPDHIPRRRFMPKWTHEEYAINEVMQKVEKLGADHRLTLAVVRLQQAQEALADYIDSKQEPNE